MRPYPARRARRDGEYDGELIRTTTKQCPIRLARMEHQMLRAAPSRSPSSKKLDGVRGTRTVILADHLVHHPQQGGWGLRGYLRRKHEFGGIHECPDHVFHAFPPLRLKSQRRRITRQDFSLQFLL